VYRDDDNRDSGQCGRLRHRRRHRHRYRHRCMHVRQVGKTIRQLRL